MAGVRGAVPVTPFVDDSDFTLYVGDVRDTSTYKPQRAATDEWRPTCSCADACGADAIPTSIAAGHRSRGSAADVGGAPSAGLTERGLDALGTPWNTPRSVSPVPCTVLDPFMGSGTVALVARKLGRRSIGVELNPAYAELCARRLQQLSLLA